MKTPLVALLLLVGCVSGESASPIGKVLELISGLQSKVISEGEKSQKIYEEFSEWCEETNKNLGFEIKTAKSEIKDLTATIDEETALIESLTTKVEELWVKLKADKNVERKWLWFDGLKSKFKEMQGAYGQHRDDPQSRLVKADRVLDYSEEDYGFPTEATYESSSSQGKAEASDDTDHQTLTPAKPTKKADDAEIMAAIRDRLQLKDPESEADKKLLRELYHAEKRTLLLEKSLKQAGIEIPEDDIPYAEAKAKVAELAEKNQGCR